MDQNSFSGQDEFLFEWIKTNDGSVTLKSTLHDAEWMHSLSGAYTESQYIYGRSLRLLCQLQKPTEEVSLLSVGLGLGYMEILAILECLQNAKTFKIISFESEPALVSLFLCHFIFLKKMYDESDLNITVFNQNKILQNPKTNIESPYKKYQIPDEDLYNSYFSYFQKDYDLKSIADHFLSIEKKTSSYVVHFKTGALEIKEALTPQNLKNKKDQEFNIIFYDAYSAFSQPELWTTEFLESFIEYYADLQICFFSTYAKTGNLNRALRNKKFNLKKKMKGFGAKRESTFAWRLSDNFDKELYLNSIAQFLS